MHSLARLARGFALAMIVTAGFVAAPTIAGATTPVVGHVYVNDNTAGTNTIGAFDQHADGSLTPLVGSPFSAGGAGTGTIVGSQGSIQATATKSSTWSTSSFAPACFARASRSKSPPPARCT